MSEINKAITVSPNITTVVERIKSGEIKKIIALSGAGISCGAGIPDFRSPGGMYDTLRPELLSASPREREYLSMNPTGVVEYSLFRNNQFPYLEVRRPFILGTAEKKWTATLSHFFLKVLEEKGLLHRLYTQNIDGLDYQIGLKEGMIVNVHGTISLAGCEACNADYPIEQFREQVMTKIRNIYDPNDPVAPQTSSNILCLNCNQPQVKPRTVMYGRSLPDEFFDCMKKDHRSADLVLIIGTSLTVTPANSVPDAVSKPDGSILLVNAEIVGEEHGFKYDDPVSVEEYYAKKGLPRASTPPDSAILGNADNSLLFLANELGFIDDLLQYKDRMCVESAKLLDEFVQGKLLNK